MRNTIYLFGAILCLSVAAVSFHEKVRPVSAVAVYQCNRLVGVVLTDSSGAVEPVDLRSPSARDVAKAIAKLPDSRVAVVQAPCPKAADRGI